MRGTMVWRGGELGPLGTINVDGKKVIAKVAASPNNYTLEQVKKMKITELRNALNALVADSKGTKAVLKERMIKIINDWLQKKHKSRSNNNSNNTNNSNSNSNYSY